MRTVLVLVTYEDEIKDPAELETIWVDTSQRYEGVKQVRAAVLDDATAIAAAGPAGL